jgi:hypothetical protein
MPTFARARIVDRLKALEKIVAPKGRAFTFYIFDELDPQSAMSGSPSSKPRTAWGSTTPAHGRIPVRVSARSWPFEFQAMIRALGSAKLDRTYRLLPTP